MNKDFIEFHHGPGCYSLAGRNGGRQRIVLASSCAEEHTLIHEVHFLSKAYLNYKTLRFSMLWAYCMSIRDQTEMSILT